MPYLKAGGRNLEYVWLGPGPTEAPTLVFLHEGLGCVSLWREFPARLAETTGCGGLVYSRAGYGRSDPTPLPRPVRFMHDEAEVLDEVLTVAGVRHAILVGHSDGGSIALIHAAAGDALRRVRALLLEAPHVFVEDLSVCSIEAARVAYETGDLRSALERHHGSNVDCAFRGWNDVWLDPAFRTWNIEACLPAITAPTFVVQGDQDAYGTLAQVHAIEAGCAGAVETLILRGCGHSPHREQPEATLVAMQSFLARHGMGHGAATSEFA